MAAVFKHRPGFHPVFLSGVLLFCLFLYAMISISISRYYFHSGSKSVNTLALGKAVLNLEKALAWVPLRAEFHLFDPDLVRSHTLLGKAYLLQAQALEPEKTDGKYGRLLEKALEHFSLAARLNPHDIKPAKGLAETTGLLEFDFSKQFPGRENPYNALPLYRQLAVLRPNGITVHYMIARYLDTKGLTEELFRTVAHIAFLCPNDVMNGDLKRERFYRPGLEAPITLGLEKAVQQGRYPRSACFALSRLMQEDGQFTRAIEYYQKGMKMQAYQNGTHTFIQLGALYLKHQDEALAIRAFEDGLKMTRDVEHSIKQIFRVFQNQKAFGAFIQFAGHVETTAGPSDILDLSVAKARMALGLNELARARLLKMESTSTNAEKFYLLAVIAERENDWDAMELNIQKALVLDPGQCHYYDKFSKALNKQGKLIQAKTQQTKKRKCTAAKQN